MPPTEPKSNSSLRDNYTHRGTFGDFLNAEIKLGRNPSFVSVGEYQSKRKALEEYERFQPNP